MKIFGFLIVCWVITSQLVSCGGRGTCPLSDPACKDYQDSGKGFPK